MFSFLIKKAFFDFWDHFFTVLILNLGYFILIAFDYFLFVILLKTFALISIPAKIGYAILILTVILDVIILFIYTGIASSITKDLTDYKTPVFNDAFIYFKETFKASILYSIIFISFCLVSYIAVTFYAKMKISESFYLVKSFPLILVFWIVIITLLASQYFFALQSSFDKKVLKNIKKMFLIMFDNPDFTIALFLGAVIIGILSVFTLFIFLGPAMITLWYNTGLKLRMYKYDYLEKKPEANKRKIPWDVLLYQDKEKVGKRSLKGLFFPWKDLNS